MEAPWRAILPPVLPQSIDVEIYQTQALKSHACIAIQDQGGSQLKEPRFAEGENHNGYFFCQKKKIELCDYT